MPELDSQPRDDKQKREAAAIAALLLLLESRAQKTLKSVFRLPIDHLVSLGATPSQVSQSMRAVGRSAIVRTRSAARDRAAHLWRKQTGLEYHAPRGAGGDVTRADAAAASLARQWEKELEDALEAGTKWPQAAEEAFVSFEWRSDRTATSEVVSAWNDEVAELNTLASGDGYRIEETWCALVDACPHCADLDGTTAVRPDRLPETPPAHPRCRCFVLTFVHEA